MRLNVARRSAGMLALLILVGSLGGCSKMMANLSLNQAQKRVKEAEDNEAAKFAEADYIAAKDAINTAQQQMNSQQYSDARRTAKDAATKAKDLVAKVKALRSSFYKSEAGTWIEHANANDGSKEDKTLYDKILQTNDAGIKAHDKEKWDDAIKSFLAVVNDTKYLLQNLKGKADTGLADVQKKKDELIAKKAPEFNPDAIIKIDDSINQIKDLIEAKVLYRLAAQEAAKAIQEGDQGITKTYENESEKLLAEVEKRLTRATQLGAELYATDTYNGVVQDYEELLKKHLQQEYAIILNETSANSGAKLLTRADDLIVETQRESARTKMEAVSKAIAKLTDGKAKTHLPGRVEMLEQMYTDAKTKFEAKDYTETEKTSLAALEEEQKIVDEFNGKTQQEMEQAEEAIRGARGVFDKMEGIFAEKMTLGDN
ncbi:DUF4398 domain-containing protein, partial [Candidatus Sumerlaeota bacterium]|nr:DUF4398 domain-containing protein [Candidatus Sumerlaeota bacterium]